MSVLYEFKSCNHLWCTIVCICLCRQCHECVLYILPRTLYGIIITSTVPAIIQFIILWALYTYMCRILTFITCVLLYTALIYIFIFILLMYCTDDLFFFYYC